MRNHESPAGRIVFGGTDAYRVFRKGQLMVSLEWINDEPAMVLYAARRRPGDGAAVIGLSAIHTYFDSRGYPDRSPQTALKVVDMLKVMGFNPVGDRFAVRDFFDALYLYADDLVKMPPEKPAKPGSDLPKGVEAIEAFMGGKKVGEITPVH